MRGPLLALLGVAACTPDIASGAYLCGPDATCPEGQACSGADNICVLPFLAEPFSCEPEVQTEPDDTPEMAYVLGELDCVSIPTSLDNCMMAGDVGDWVKFTTSAGCTSIAVDARVTFPIAFERMALELWDLDRGELLATDTECENGSAEAGHDVRCVAAALQNETTYGVQVRPSGEGNCNGECSYNRYTFRLQLVPPP